MLSPPSVGEAKSSGNGRSSSEHTSSMILLVAAPNDILFTVTAIANRLFMSQKPVDPPIPVCPKPKQDPSFVLDLLNPSPNIPSGRAIFA